MPLGENTQADYYIKEYLLINTRIKIAEIKIEYAKCIDNKSSISKNQAKIEKLTKFKQIVDDNIEKKYIEKFEIFTMKLPECAKVFRMSTSSITKLKSKIRKEFMRVIEIVKNIF